MSKVLQNGSQKWLIVKKFLYGANHVLIAANTTYLTYHCCKVGFKDWTSWHALCGTFGYQLLMAQGILAFHPQNMLTSALKKPAKVKLHQILQGTGAALALTGIVIQYLNKEMFLKIDHLGSPHSVMGAISVTSLILSVTSGISTAYSSKIRHIIKPASIRRIHNAVTVVAFSSGMLALIGAYMTKKFIIENDPNEMRKWLAASTATTLLITVASPMRSLFRGRVL